MTSRGSGHLRVALFITPFALWCWPVAAQATVPQPATFKVQVYSGVGAKWYAAIHQLSNLEQNVAEHNLIVSSIQSKNGFRWLLPAALFILGVTLGGGFPGQRAHSDVLPWFTDITQSSGLSKFRTTFGTPAKRYILEGAGAGCALFDYDNDGWLDIYLVNGTSFGVLRGTEKPFNASALFHNNRNGTFSDVTAQAGVANLGAWGTAVSSGDFDNDGWADLYVSNYGANKLYRNNGDGTFSDVTAKAKVGLGPWTWSTGSSFGDYDGDGWLDLFVAGYVQFDLNKLPEREAKDGKKTYCSYRGAAVFCGPRGLPSEPDHLFHNNGDGTFSEVSQAAGVNDKLGYYGFGGVWFDYDDDRKLDLLVVNDSTPNYLYRNLGQGRFEEIGYPSGIAVNEDGREQAGMGVAIGDYDNDGRTDLYITNFSDDVNTLRHNEGQGIFNDVTSRAGLGAASYDAMGWGTVFFDYDHDGWLDVFVANGQLYPEADLYQWPMGFLQPKLLFRNLGNGLFAEVGQKLGGALALKKSARGTAFGDLDNDGDLDLVVTNMDDAPTIIRNDLGQQSGHWLMLKLVGEVKAKSPRDAIGAKVFVTVNGKRLQRAVMSGGSYASHSDLRLHFGLGSAKKVDVIEVHWPSGKIEKFPATQVDRTLTLIEGKGVKASVMAKGRNSR